MLENQPTNVVAAFEILLEELEAEIDFVNRIGAKAFEERTYERAKEALELAGKITGFRDKVAALRREWQTIAMAEPEEDEEARIQRRNLGRLQRGIRTREEFYYGPILQALIEKGGSARMPEVINRVGELMKGILKPVDYEPLSSDPDTPRWRNAAQWARWSMVQDGLLKADSPRGIWEITDLGRRWLEQHSQKGENE
ncbi:MAG: winged helix-turn-helix domain-containing protein [candidate division WOR-3 bacterium]